MRYFILLVSFCFCALFSKAQSQENTYKNNNTNNTGMPGTVKADTTKATPQLEEIMISEEKKTRTYKKEKSLSPGLISTSEGKVEGLKDSNSSSQLQSAKYQFETNYSNSRHQLYRRSPSDLEISKMKQSAQLYTDILPGSFEKHFYTYLVSKYNPKQFPELKQAAQLNPNKTEVQQELAVYGFATNNQQLADSVTLQMISQNKITNGVLNYASDLVNSVPSNGTLLLHGYTELIPANFERNNLNRSDIELISVDLMQSPDYQQNLSSKGFVMPNSTYIDTAFVQEFCSLNASKNIYLSMSFPKEYFQGISKSLHPVGLTFGYKLNQFDYNAWNANLIESVWQKNKLGISQDAQSDALSANYLPALISIERLYQEYNKSEEAKEMSALIMSVATRARKTGQLSKINR
ncbi:hypothetical protein [Fluviicola sp.]|uniref:hypothetical protein n=1 Tax=Fluviicola sp. TaxID=1917219 RepID=UPI00262EEFCB|nr:hypothetical protein [Fluviicola sp.]